MAAATGRPSRRIYFLKSLAAGYRGLSLAL
jgi:hypothetical protein